MSVSFNNRPHVNVDQFSLDNKPVASAKSPGNSNVQSSGTPISQAGLRNEKPPVLNNQVMVPGAAFTKLFDMLEQIFSAITPDATPTSTVVPDITSKLLPEEPGEVLTSPGPDEIQFNARNWQLNVRNAYKS